MIYSLYFDYFGLIFITKMMILIFFILYFKKKKHKNKQKTIEKEAQDYQKNTKFKVASKFSDKIREEKLLKNTKIKTFFLWGFCLSFTMVS